MDNWLILMSTIIRNFRHLLEFRIHWFFFHNVLSLSLESFRLRILSGPWSFTSIWQQLFISFCLLYVHVLVPSYERGLRINRVDSKDSYRADINRDWGLCLPRQCRTLCVPRQIRTRVYMYKPHFLNSVAHTNELQIDRCVPNVFNSHNL